MKSTKLRIAGIGELLWDVLPESENLGGAPVNFAYNVNELGAIGIPLSTVGYDIRAEKAIELLQEKRVDTRAITRADRITGYVQVAVDRNGVAGYMFPDDVAWDHLLINEYGKSIVEHLDAVCFGSLAQRSHVSRKAIYSYLDGLKKETVKVYDINLRQNFYSAEIIESSLRRADIFKLNDEELEIVSKLMALPGKTEEVIDTLLGRYNLKMVILSMGEKGSWLVTSTKMSRHPGLKAKVVDTIGAGDAFTAATTICYLQGLALDEINEQANRVASFVCSQRGAMNSLPDHLKLN